ncbi:MAG: hypothetical protein RLY57_127 [Candidatus Parcubacteria bacterium]|jgi:thiamine biosynthesis lipoprotein
MLNMQEYEYTGKAMGTEYTIAIITDTKETADLLSAAAIVEIHDYEKRFSRFLPHSELSQLNNEMHMKVSQAFLEVVEKAYELYEKTQGIFNPLIQVHRLGYDKDFSVLEKDAISDKTTTSQPVAIASYNIDFSSVIINKKESTITLHPGQQLDVGGFLKGYLAEKLCKKIKNSSPSIKGVIVNIGGDIYTQGTDSDGSHFVFTIYNPITGRDDISLPLYNQSLATSGTYKRTWNTSGIQRHHIIDVSGTQNPKTTIVSASVIHPDGAASEAYTKVCMTHGINASQFLDESFQFILIHKDGSITQQS